MGAALVLAALYGIFIHAVQTARHRHRTRARRAVAGAGGIGHPHRSAQRVIISGGIIAASLEGGTNDTGGPGGSSLPGYLKLTTTTGRDTGVGPLWRRAAGGILPRRTIPLRPRHPAARKRRSSSCAPSRATCSPRHHAVPRTRNKSCAACSRWPSNFTTARAGSRYWDYDSTAAALTSGSDASSGTVITTGNTTLPDAVRIRRAAGAATPTATLPPPVEVLVPWTTQPFAGATPRHQRGRRFLRHPDAHAERIARAGGVPGGDPPGGGGQPVPGGRARPRVDRPPPDRHPPAGGRTPR